MPSTAQACPCALRQPQISTDNSQQVLGEDSGETAQWPEGEPPMSGRQGDKGHKQPHSLS